MAKKTKKEDDLFGSIPPPEEFDAFPSVAFPDEMISTLTTSESEKGISKDTEKNRSQMNKNNNKECHDDMTLQNDTSSQRVSKVKKNKIEAKNKKNNRTESKDKNTGQISMSNSTAFCHDQMTLPNDIDKEHVKIAWHINEPPLLKTKNQKKLFNYLKRHGSMITTIGNLAKKTKISSRTVQRILTLFEDVGYILKEKYINGDIQGIKIIVLDRLKEEDKNSYYRRKKQSSFISSNLSRIDPKIYSELLKEGAITLTQESLKRFFSNLADAGFTSQEIEKIIVCLKKIRENY